MHEREAAPHGQLVDPVLCVRAVGRVDHDVDILEQGGLVRVVQARVHAADEHVSRQAGRCGRRLRAPDVRGAVEDLSRHVGELDDVGIE